MMMNACQKAGFPELEIEEVAGGIQITFVKNNTVNQCLTHFALNRRQKKALDYVKENGSITNTEYQNINNTTKKTSSRDLQDLVDKSMLRKMGTTGRGTFYVISDKAKGTLTGH